jgi:hypothetical protein
MLLCGLAWEASTRSYLRGFSDAVVPASGAPEQTVESILTWMAYGPARRAADSPGSFAQRDPEETLNYQQLLRVCGTATNAFVNLARASGLDVRRLLLLNPDRSAKHVVAEVWLDGRWAVVDPSYRILFRDARGRVLTKEQLRNPGIFRQATQIVPGYSQSLTYESTSRVHLSGIPVIGRILRRLLDWAVPRWEDEFDWTLMLERESFALVVAASFLLFCSVATRFLLSWYGDQRLGVSRMRFREQLRRAGAALLTSPDGVQSERYDSLTALRAAETREPLPKLTTGDR